MKKTLVLILTTILMVSCYAFTAKAAPGKNVKLIIEGNSSRIISESYSVNTSTATGVLLEIDSMENRISLTISSSAYGSYLTGVNGETSGSKGTNSGWMIKVNGVAPSVGMDSIPINDGDTILLYFADMYAQNPVPDYSRIEEGIISFSSEDTTYDSSWNPIVSTNPVVGATVKWYTGENTFSTYTTDSSGEITIAEEELTEGFHRVAIEKYNAEGANIAIRLADDEGVTISGQSGEPQGSGENQSENNEEPAGGEEEEPGNTVETGDSLFILIAVAVLSAAGMAVARNKRKTA